MDPAVAWYQEEQDGPSKVVWMRIWETNSDLYGSLHANYGPGNNNNGQDSLKVPPTSRGIAGAGDQQYNNNANSGNNTNGSNLQQSSPAMEGVGKNSSGGTMAGATINNGNAGNGGGNAALSNSSTLNGSGNNNSNGANTPTTPGGGNNNTTNNNNSGNNVSSSTTANCEMITGGNGGNGGGPNMVGKGGCGTGIGGLVSNEKNYNPVRKKLGSMMTDNKASTFNMNKQHQRLIGVYGGCPWRPPNFKYGRGIIG
uniref:Uncharacterized protein n=1 Tax=Anopheles dirus TaxID=7168 RepID=A0A182N5U9_9DIPT